MSTATKKNPSGLSARLLELHAETNVREPYEIADGIVVTPLTRTRSRALHQAEAKKYIASQVWARRAATVIAEDPPTPPENPTDEQRAEYDAALKAWTTSFDVDRVHQQMADADAEWEHAFFGDAHDAVMEFFEDKPALWDKFIVDIKKALLPAEPDSGTCPTCGHIVDEDQAGKAPGSSTSSTTTGT